MADQNSTAVRQAQAVGDTRCAAGLFSKKYETVSSLSMFYSN